MKVRYTRQAIRDLSDIAAYIAEDRPAASRDVIARIRNAILSLTRHPGLGRVGRVDGTRELLVAGLPFIAAYVIEAEEVHVLAVVHTARTWPERF